ncbi:MAG: hypothetical protein IH621_01940 [Krumholzibacteria bacterium]|nr:hypothetical protein [Candidatus Krumholzibacteria bacterium]
MKAILPIALMVSALLHAGCAATPAATAARETDTNPTPLAAADALESGFQHLADQIVAGLRTKQASEIAVVQFTNLDGSVSEFGAFIAEEMTTRLYQAGTFRVVERELLRKVMAEHELATTGLFDEATAKELGKLLGVDAITAGSVTDLGSQVRINSRLIATETGSVFSAAAVTLPKDERVVNLMSHRLAGPDRTVDHTDAVSRSSTRSGAEPKSAGLVADYFNLSPNTTDIPMEGPIFERIDATINCSYDGRPVPRVNPDWFGIRWTGYILIGQPGQYTLGFKNDDFLRVWIGDQKVYDRRGHTAKQWITVDVSFDETGWLPFRAELVEITGPAYCGFRWALPGAADFTAVDAEQFRHD